MEPCSALSYVQSMCVTHRLHVLAYSNRKSNTNVVNNNQRNANGKELMRVCLLIIFEHSASRNPMCIKS